MRKHVFLSLLVCTVGLGCADSVKVERVAEWACEWNLVGDFPSLDHLPAEAEKEANIRKEDLAFAADPRKSQIYEELGKRYSDELKPAAAILTKTRASVAACEVASVDMGVEKKKATANLNVTTPVLEDERAVVEAIAALASPEEKLGAAQQALSSATNTKKSYKIHFVKEDGDWKLNLDLPQASASRREYIDLKHRFEKAVKTKDDAGAKKLLQQALAIAPSKEAAAALEKFATNLEIQLRVDGVVEESKKAFANNDFKEALAFAEKALSIQPDDADLKELVASMKTAAEQGVAGGWLKVRDNPIVIELTANPTTAAKDRTPSVLRVMCDPEENEVSVAIKPDKNLNTKEQEVTVKISFGQTEYSKEKMDHDKNIVFFRKGRDWVKRIASSSSRMSVRIPEQSERSSVFNTSGANKVKKLIDDACPR